MKGSTDKPLRHVALRNVTGDEKDTSSATWKFAFEDTVNADPLANGACLGVIRAFLHFASKSDPTAFSSLPDLMLATSSSRPTVKKAIKLLIRLGYLVPLYVTDGGAMKYRLVNSRKELIDDHIRMAKISLAAERADRKKRERLAKGVKETCSPETVETERIFPPKVKETYPNTVEELRRVSSTEGGCGSLRGTIPSNSNTYADISNDLTVPFAIPASEDETDEILASLGDVHPQIRASLRRMHLAGELTPALLMSNFGGRDA